MSFINLLEVDTLAPRFLHAAYTREPKNQADQTHDKHVREGWHQKTKAPA